jgi:hypothetical protein
MTVLEIIIIIILISWAFCGFLFIPVSGGLFNLLIVILVAMLTWQVIT